MKQLMIPFQSQFLLYLFLFIILGACMVKSPFLVNSGMFHYFAFSIGTGVLTLFFIIQSGFREFKIAFSLPLSLFVIWGTYIAIHTLNIGSKEWYQGGYLVLSCVYVIAMCHLVRKKQSITEQILLLFGLAGLVQAFVCILQYVEILPPCNATFSISGTLDNPNITAMYIVAVIPVFLFSSTQRKLKLLILVPLLLALLTLNCRTAFLGCLIILLIYLYFNERFLSIIKRTQRKFLYLLSILFLSFLILFAYQQYQGKKASADGRLLVWKITTQLIAQNTIMGSGYGLFAKNYNLCQADYFDRGNGSFTERANARYVYTCYNEYLEQTSKGGIIGFILFLLPLVLFIRKAFQLKNKKALAILLSIALMACTNFIQTAIPVWMLLLTVYALLAAQDHSLKYYQLPKIIWLLFFSFALFFTINQVIKFVAHYQFKERIEEAKQRNITISPNIIKQYLPSIGSSEICLCIYAKSLIRASQHRQALLVLLEAEKYSSSPALLFDKVICYQNLALYPQATATLRLISNIRPSDFFSRFQLLCLYRRFNEIEKMKQIAQELLSIKVKNESNTIRYYRKMAQESLQYSP